jgi:hypothetical protein
MIAELRTELQNTAYDLETDQAVADYLNGLVAVEVTEIKGSQIYNTMVPADFVGLTAENQQYVRDIISLGSVNVSEGTNARAVLISVFTGLPTLKALAALTTKQVTRASLIGINSTVMDYHVAEARNG